MAGSDGERSFSTILQENEEAQYYHRLQTFYETTTETTTRTSKKE